MQGATFLQGGLKAQLQTNPGVFVFVIVLIIGVAVGVQFGIRHYLKMRRLLALPENIERIRNTVGPALEKQQIFTGQGRSGLQPIRSDATGAIPDDEQMLINYNVLGSRLVGYLGGDDTKDTQQSGIFDEDTAVRCALGTGARCLILEIDHLTDQNEPILTQRDGWGVRRSLNDGNITKVAKSIAERAFVTSGNNTPPQLTDDPLFVVLQIVSAPDRTAQAREQVRFLSKLAEKLKPLKPYLMSNSSVGNFSRQGMESQLFFTNINVFRKKIILLCNANTELFRNLNILSMQGEISSDQDLDLLVHCRIFSHESPSGFGITEAESKDRAPAAVFTTLPYWLNTPSDRLATAAEQTKKAWTICMPPVASNGLDMTKDKLTKLLTNMGVHCLPFAICDKKLETEPWIGNEGHQKTSAWQIKPQIIRVGRKKIAIKNPPPETNANGGAIIVPSF